MRYKVCRLTVYKIIGEPAGSHDFYKEVDQMRGNKKLNKNRNEILDAAARLFAIKGYDQCAVNDILHEVSLSKGTFYYYFKSKEEVLDAIIGRVSELIAARVEKVATDPEMSPVMKLMSIFLSMSVENEVKGEFMQELHKPQNALMHQKSLSTMVTRITPVLVKVVEEGIEQGVFKSEFPKE